LKRKSTTNEKGGKKNEDIIDFIFYLHFVFCFGLMQRVQEQGCEIQETRKGMRMEKKNAE